MTTVDLGVISGGPLDLHRKVVESQALRIALVREAQLRVLLPEEHPVWRSPLVQAANAPNN